MELSVTRRRYKTIGGDVMFEYSFVLNDEKVAEITVNEREDDEFNPKGNHHEFMVGDWLQFIDGVTFIKSESVKKLVKLLNENELEINNLIAQKQIERLKREIKSFEEYLIK